MHQGPWQVLHVVANHEKKVAQHLSVRSCEHFLPLYQERSRWTDRQVVLERPLFIGYVFVRYLPGEKLSVITVPGVLRVLGDSELCTVSDEEIARIRDGLASGYLLRPHANLSVGTKVRVRRGVFEGVEGVVSAIRQHCKVVISIGALRQSFSLDVDARDIDVLRSESATVGGREVHQEWFNRTPVLN
jgi:transcription antitermination factor NusG